MSGYACQLATPFGTWQLCWPDRVIPGPFAVSAIGKPNTYRLQWHATSFAGAELSGSCVPPAAAASWQQGEYPEQRDASTNAEVRQRVSSHWSAWCSLVSVFRAEITGKAVGCRLSSSDVSTRKSQGKGKPWTNTVRIRSVPRLRMHATTPFSRDSKGGKPFARVMKLDNDSPAVIG